MREYLYRGIRVDNHKWVEGYYVKAQKLNGDDYEYFIIEEAADGRSHLVIPESVGEYTGIHDKNGKKIFENDIVRTQPFYDRPYSSKRKGKQFVGVVEYTTHKFNGNRFYPEQTYDARWRVNIAEDIGKYVHSSWSNFWGCEVIGNVFENSELLEG